MGIIKRQGLKQAIVGYTATAIGAVSTLFIYPLDKEIYGYALFLISTASLLDPFFSGGIYSLVVRFFPDFETEDGKNNGFLGLIQIGLLIAFSSVFLLSFLFANAIQDGLVWLEMDADLVFDNLFPILCLTFLIAQINILNYYASNYKRIVIPAIISNLWLKVALPVLILLFYFGIIDQFIYSQGVVGMYLLAVIGLLIYLKILGGFNFNITPFAWKTSRLKEMINYAAYGMFGLLGNILAFRIDLIMVATLIDLSSTGVYGIAQFIGNSIEIPKRALFSISAPIISKATKEGNLPEITMIYRKASLNLFIVGALIFILTISSLDALFQLTKDYTALIQGFVVVIYIGLAKIVDMATSVNGQIIAYSKYFRFNFYMVALTAAMNIGLNFWLIPIMGISGAALASLISITFTNIIRLFFVAVKWNIQPFSIQHLYCFLLAGVLLYLGLSLSLGALHPAIQIVVRSAIIGLLYIPVVLYFRMSPDLNEMVVNALARFRKSK